MQCLPKAKVILFSDQWPSLLLKNASCLNLESVSLSHAFKPFVYCDNFRHYLDLSHFFDLYISLKTTPKWVSKLKLKEKACEGYFLELPMKRTACTDPLIYLMERVLPHVSASQRLIKGEHHRVVFSIRLVAPLSDPAFVVCQRVMKAPVTEEERNSKD